MTGFDMTLKYWFRFLLLGDFDSLYEELNQWVLLNMFQFMINVLKEWRCFKGSV